MTVKVESGEKLFEEARDAIESALRFVAFRRRLGPNEFHELRSFVMLKLVENDYGRLRKHESQGSLTAYLSVVVHRLYLDYQITKWGKWHVSAEAERRGDVAIALERLIYRDGYDVAEAVEILVSRGEAAHSRDELRAIAYAIPVRHRPRLVGEELLYSVAAHGSLDPVEKRERDALGRRLQCELTRVMESLDREDRRVLAMRYRDRQTVPEIARELGLETKPLYARIRKVLARVRARLERAGLAGDSVMDLLGSSARQIDVDAVFGRSASAA